MINLIQLKMAGGDEVICEVMEWPEPETKDMIIRNAMVLTHTFDEDMEMVYGLKPWFAMIENNMEYMVVNTDHIIGTTKPNASFVMEYNDALSQMHSLGFSRKLDRKTKMEAEMERVSKVKERLSRTIDEVVQRLSGADSAQSNVIQFPPPDTNIH